MAEAVLTRSTMIPARPAAICLACASASGKEGMCEYDRLISERWGDGGWRTIVGLGYRTNDSQINTQTLQHISPLTFPLRAQCSSYDFIACKRKERKSATSLLATVPSVSTYLVGPGSGDDLVRDFSLVLSLAPLVELLSLVRVVLHGGNGFTRWSVRSLLRGPGSEEVGWGSGRVWRSRWRVVGSQLTEKNPILLICSCVVVKNGASEGCVEARERETSWAGVPVIKLEAMGSIRARLWGSTLARREGTGSDRQRQLITFQPLEPLSPPPLTTTARSPDRSGPKRLEHGPAGERRCP